MQYYVAFVVAYKFLRRSTTSSLPPCAAHRQAPRLALAAFDDSNLDDGAFPALLAARREAAWHTWDCAYMRAHADAAPLATLSARLRAAGDAALARRPPGAPLTKLVDAAGRLVSLLRGRGSR